MQIRFRSQETNLKQNIIIIARVIKLERYKTQCERYKSSSNCNTSRITFFIVTLFFMTI